MPVGLTRSPALQPLRNETVERQVIAGRSPQTRRPRPEPGPCRRSPMPVRTRSSCASWYRIAPAVFAAWSTRGAWPAADLSTRRERVELVLRRHCVVSAEPRGGSTAPSTSKPAIATHPIDERRSPPSGGHTPMRCIPVSTFTCTPIGATPAAAAMRSSAGPLGVQRRGQRAATAATSDPAGTPRARGRAPRCRRRAGRGPPRPGRRRAMSHPPSSAAPADRTAPCPYPSAFTTAISSAPSAASARTLCAIASRSTSTQVATGSGARSCVEHRSHRVGQACRRHRRPGCPHPTVLTRERSRRPRGDTRRPHAASSGSSPCARSPPIMPVSTSPEPAVASTGVPVRLIDRPPGRFSDDRAVPFSSATASAAVRERARVRPGDRSPSRPSRHGPSVARTLRRAG